MSEVWNEVARDDIYTALCNAVTQSGDRSELFLSRLSLLLIEQLGSPERARQAIADATLDES